MTILVRPVQPQKASPPIFTTESGIAISVSPVQPSKAPFPIAVTELGITVPLQPAISVLLSVSIMALQLSRESYFLLPAETVIVVRLSHWLNNASPMVVNDAGISMLVSPQQQENACSPISCTELGIVIAVSPVQSWNLQIVLYQRVAI